MSLACKDRFHMFLEFVNHSDTNDQILLQPIQVFCIAQVKMLAY